MPCIRDHLRLAHLRGLATLQVAVTQDDGDDDMVGFCPEAKVHSLRPQQQGLHWSRMHACR
jgi:hypothetical protein